MKSTPLPSHQDPQHPHNANGSTAISGQAPITHRSGSRIERIAWRAHELYETRGGTDGAAMEDWLQAEREVDAETTSS